MSRPAFRFAVQATNASGATEWRDTALKAQDLGYSTLFLADHYLGPGPAQRAARTPRQDLAPIAAMAVAATWPRKRPRLTFFRTDVSSSVSAPDGAVTNTPRWG